jgi:hypothetical protein
MSQTDPQAILEQVYPLVYRVDGEIIAVSPRPGLWLGICDECEQWVPLSSEPLGSTIELASSLPFEDIPIVLEVDDTPSGWCQPCSDRLGEEDEVLPSCCNMACTCDEECDCDEDCECPCDFSDQDPDGLEWHSVFHHIPVSGENTVILQCNATTDEGRRCEARCAAWDFASDPAITDGRPADKPFNDMDFWLCKEHVPECPHCDFATGGKLAELRDRTNQWLLDHVTLRDAEGDCVGRGLHCMTCFCMFDANLELVDDLVDTSGPCPIWGRGARPGTIGEALFNNPALFVEAFKYSIDAEDKRKRLKEWREQLKREQEEGDPE